MIDKIVLRCPDCNASKSRVNSRKDGTCRCGACGKEDTRDKFDIANQK